MCMGGVGSKVDWRSQVPLVILVMVLLLGVACAVYFVKISTERALSGLEAVLLQFFTMVLSILPTVKLSAASSRKQAADAVRPHARSAFRRLTSIAAGMGSLRVMLADEKLRFDMDSVEYHVIEKVEIAVGCEGRGVVDALADWEDIVPDEVTDLRKRANDQAQT